MRGEVNVGRGGEKQPTLRHRMGRDVGQLQGTHGTTAIVFFPVPAHEDNHLPTLLTSYFDVALGVRVRVRVKASRLRNLGLDQR
jgi:hypothetical protein